MAIIVFLLKEINCRVDGKTHTSEDGLYFTMKNIMIIDGAINCGYDVYQATEDEFKVIFPMKNQDIQFIEDIENEQGLDNILQNIRSRPISKKNANGIDGILFYELIQKKEFYPNKKDSDLDYNGRSFSTTNIDT